MQLVRQKPGKREVWHVGDKFQDQLEYYEGEIEKWLNTGK